MRFSPEVVAKLQMEAADVLVRMMDLRDEIYVVGQAEQRVEIRMHLHEGVCRRLSLMHRSLSRIFQEYPPDLELASDSDVEIVTIDLHAFIINLVGLFDNFAWAVVHRDGIEADPNRISVFKGPVKTSLSAGLRAFIDSISSWHRDYLKEYRDSLAHRIPPYIPEFEIVSQNLPAWRRAKFAWADAVNRHKSVQEINELLRAVQRFEIPTFQYSLSPYQQIRSVRLHPQLIIDARTAAEFGRRFLDEWRRP